MTSSASRKSRATRKSKSANRSSLTPWLIGGGILFVALIGAVVWAYSRPSQAPVSQLDLPAGWVDGLSMGDPAATVVVQAWEDFLCPHCQEWTAVIEPKIIEDYVKTGQVRFEYHPLPLSNFEPGSSMGAHAALCAADQAAFWPYHDLLFATARTRGQQGFTLDILLQNAEELGLDSGQFQQCMGSQLHRAALDASLAEATRLGLTSTPSLLINGNRIGDPFDYATVQSEIDQLASAAQ